MIVLVFGGRDYLDCETVFTAIDRVHWRAGISHVIHGGSSGADCLAHCWAYINKIKATPFIANWQLGRKAGPIRNQRMIDEGKPDMGLGFPGGAGTADMLRRLLAAGIAVELVGK